MKRGGRSKAVGGSRNIGLKRREEQDECIQENLELYSEFDREPVRSGRCGERRGFNNDVSS